MMNDNQNGSVVLKRFIRYLYEYEQGKRMRNVGFVKVEQGEDECMVHIHGKGLRMGDDRSLQIYLLFEKEGKCFGIWQGEADNINPAVNECISYTVEDTGTPENYEKINGLALQNRDGRRYAAIWDERPMDLSDMRVWNSDDVKDSKDESRTGEDSVEEQMTSPEKEEENFPGEEPEDVPEDESREMPGMQAVLEQTEETSGKVQAVSEQAGTEDIIVTQESDDSGDDLTGEIPALRSEDLFFMEEPVNPRSQQRWRTRKIQRTELAKLARCEWRLANNNFLLHGYYNYHHLILLEKGDQLMLGVPGIYHEKEAAAAGAFGFPEFIGKDRLDVNLSPEEYNEEQPFGYWCRPVKRAFKWE